MLQGRQVPESSVIIDSSRALFPTAARHFLLGDGAATAAAAAADHVTNTPSAVRHRTGDHVQQGEVPRHGALCSPERPLLFCIVVSAPLLPLLSICFPQTSWASSLALRCFPSYSSSSTATATTSSNNISCCIFAELKRHHALLRLRPRCRRCTPKPAAHSRPHSAPPTNPVAHHPLTLRFHSSNSNSISTPIFPSNSTATCTSTSALSSISPTSIFT